MSNPRFADYPEPRLVAERPKTQSSAPKEDENPVLRGMPLTVAAAVISWFPSVQKYFWTNAKFGSLRDVRELVDYPFRIDPTVTPLSDGTPVPDLLSFGPELTTARISASASDESPLRRYLTAADYHALYKAGVITPLDVAAALVPFTRRGGKHEQDTSNPFRSAFVDTYGKGEELAWKLARASAERWSKGEPLGVMDGVPVCVKDDTDIEGIVAHRGLKAYKGLSFFEPAKETAWPVRGLIDAGALVIGKNTMHELGSDTSGCNPNWGTPTNHYNPDYYPGGSSSGTSSVLGAGMVPIGVGTDAGGSIRLPAAFNGLYGLKPSQSRTCSMAISCCVTGPLAASAADLTIAYRLMSKPNPDDPKQRVFAPSVPPSLSQGKTGVAVSAPKLLAVDKAWWAGSDPEVLSACEAALVHFQTVLGYEVLDISLPYVREAQLAHGLICITEMHQDLLTNFPTIDPVKLLLPANKVLLSIASQTPARDYLAANRLRALLMSHLAALFRDHPGLIVLSPTTPLLGWRRHPADDARGFSDNNVGLRNMKYINIANLVGCPAVQAPVGYAAPPEGDANGKLPVGMMAMGEWGAEEQLLEWAAEAEKYLDGLPGGRLVPKDLLDVPALAKAARKAPKGHEESE